MAALAEALPDDVASLKAMLLAERARADRLAQIIKELQGHRFGRRAETLPIDQLELGLEDVQQVEAAQAAEAEASGPAAKTARVSKRRTNRGSLPSLLPRFEVVIDVETKACPCCAGDLHRIGEDVSERLDIIPAQIHVLVTRRPKYACRACEEGVVQATPDTARWRSAETCSSPSAGAMCAGASTSSPPRAPRRSRRKPWPASAPCTRLRPTSVVDPPGRVELGGRNEPGR